MSFPETLTRGSGGSRPSDNGGGGGHLDPEIRGARSPKKNFGPLGPQFGPKIRGGGPPGPLPGIRHLGVLTIYKNHPCGNLVHKHKTINFVVVGGSPTTKHEIS